MTPKQKKRRFFILLIIALFLAIIINTHTLKADAGPKPYIEINLKNMKSNEYYVTLISERKNYGPHHYHEEGEEKYYNDYDKYPEIWEKFYNYVDNNGFYFWNKFEKFTGDGSYRWGYYPPQTFKLLLYFPQTDSFVVSEIYERYAFSSKFTFNLNRVKSFTGDIALITEPVKLDKQSVFFSEVFKFLFRVSITVGIEMFIAFLFFFRMNAKEFSIIVLVNVCTQVLLNIALSIWTFNLGFGWIEIPFLIAIELIIFVVEGFAYLKLLKEELLERNASKWMPFLYSFVANLVSFVLGYVLVMLTTYYF